MPVAALVAVEVRACVTVPSALRVAPPLLCKLPWAFWADTAPLWLALPSALRVVLPWRTAMPPCAPTAALRRVTLALPCPSVVAVRPRSTAPFGPLRATPVWVAVLQASLDAVIRAHTPADGRVPARFAVIAMGRLGGGELGYGSDADVMFVCEANEGFDDVAAVKWSTTIAEQVKKSKAMCG